MATLNLITMGVLVILACLLTWLVAYSIFWTIRERIRRKRAERRIEQALTAEQDRLRARHEAAQQGDDPAAPEPPAMRIMEDLDPDSPFDQDPGYVAMRHKAILMAFETGRPVIGDASGVRFADEERRSP